MPAATGKTTLLKSLPCDDMQEADDICHPRRTQELSDLRSQAKQTGDWKQYDILLSREILTRVSPKTRVILLASSDLANALNLEVLGSVVLDMPLWSANVASRNEDVMKYLDHYNKAIIEGAYVCSSYSDLAHEVIRLRHALNKQ